MTNEKWFRNNKIIFLKKSAEKDPNSAGIKQSKHIVAYKIIFDQIYVRINYEKFCGNVSTCTFHDSKQPRLVSQKILRKPPVYDKMVQKYSCYIFENILRKRVIFARLGQSQYIAAFTTSFDQIYASISYEKFCGNYSCYFYNSKQARMISQKFCGL